MIHPLIRTFSAALFFVLSAVNNDSYSKPRLVVVISLDQFPYEYLTRFRGSYGSQGFKYLMEHGASFSNAVYMHAATSTGPGHAAILTGAYGNQNGIVANAWYDAASRQMISCVADKMVSTIPGGGEGKSPANLIVPTFGDELRLHTGFASKVISVSHKDRSAILMGGKLANGAFWLVDSLFVTSTYYMKSLPGWVKKFNESGRVNSYFGKTWERILPHDAYTTLDADDVPYESTWSTIGRTFPHVIRGKDSTRITGSYYDALKTSPFDMEMLAAFAKAAVESEHLGDDGHPDLLCIGFSATDEVGHSFGPHSREVIEMAVQTDRVVADFLRYLNARIGLKNVIVVLTSDHGVAPIPEYVKAHYPNADVGRLSPTRLKELCNLMLTHAFGKAAGEETWISRIIGGNVYLNHDAMAAKKIKPRNLAAVMADSLMNLHEIALAVSREELFAIQSPLATRLRKSFHPKRSGDVLFALRPYFYLDDGSEGAEHGNPYDHDAHVPLIIMGEGMRTATYAAECSPVDIGPTLSALLGIEFPAGREGRVLVEALRLP